MADQDIIPPSPKHKRHDDPPSSVLQIERHDFTGITPTDRPRAQPMQGFDPVYTDIVDYIVRCTHRIWDEKNVGLIYSHYTHNCVVHSTAGTTYSREEVVRATLQRIAEFPERRGYATSVIWNGNDKTGFYTSHAGTSVGRHTISGPNGPATGKTYYSRTLVDCMIFENRIYREWLVRDNMAMMRSLGVDLDAMATRQAAEQASRGITAPVLGDSSRLLGQQPPRETADMSIANNEIEAHVLRTLHEAINCRMFGVLRDFYAPSVMWHGPGMRDLYGISSAIHQTISLIAMVPDCTWSPQHLCSVESDEGGTKVALRWVIEGLHTGWGALGAPTGRPLFIMGISHFHLRDGLVVEESTLYDELALRVQLKLPQ